MRRTLCAALSGFALAASAIVALAPAASAVAIPPVPSGEHVSAATSTSFTVTMNTASPVTGYRVLIARTAAELYVANVSSRTQHATSSSSSVTLSGLSYTTAPWYYRAQLWNGTAYKWGTVIGVAGLRPAAPTGVHATTSSTGTYLSWTPQSVGTGFEIVQALNASMTTGRVTQLLRGPNYQFTPALLAKGQPYYFQIVARNQSTLSSASAVVSVTPTSAQTSLRVMTYNVIEHTSDGAVESGNAIAPWSSRRAGVAKLINQGSPDVMGIQEAAAYVGLPAGYGGVRQIDDLLKLLPNYALARTEVPPTEHGYYRIGTYIIYKKSTMQPYGTGGHVDIGDGRWGVYQEMQVRSTGAKFLFVTAHLISNTGSSYDTARENETKALIRDAGSVAASARVRVVYAADFNSDDNSQHAFDGPAIAMRAAHNTDARDAAPYHYNENFNSFNGYSYTPAAAGDDIDVIFLSPGFASRSWGVLINLVNGRFSGTIPSDHNPIWSTITVTGP